jgi:hypothetical protein
MEPVVLLFVLLGLVMWFTARTLRRRQRRHEDPGSVARGAVDAQSQGPQPLVPPSPPGIFTGGTGGSF